MRRGSARQEGRSNRWRSVGLRLVGLYGGFHRFDVGGAGGNGGLRADRPDGEHDDAGENCEDHNHYEKFNQRKAIRSVRPSEPVAGLVCAHRFHDHTCIYGTSASDFKGYWGYATSSRTIV
jgi:hypothetical protein